jgi:hypothetical protein
MVLVRCLISYNYYCLAAFPAAVVKAGLCKFGRLRPPPKLSPSLAQDSTLKQHGQDLVHNFHKSLRTQAQNKLIYVTYQLTYDAINSVHADKPYRKK